MNVYLRAFELKDLSYLNEWHNDPMINELTGGRKRFVSSEYDKKWIEDKIFNTQKQVYCAICILNPIDQIIGYISLNDIDYINRTAFWGGVIIDPLYRGKGAATQAALKLLEYGFFELGLQKISGKWVAEHTTSMFMAQALGFVQEGVLRRDVYKNGQYYDVAIMSILRTEFIMRHGDEK